MLGNGHIDWNHFTPGAALLGGLVLGLAAALLVVLKGRILGISGIVGGLLRPQAGDRAWRIAFLLGLLAAPWLWQTLWGPIAMTVDASTTTLVVAGVLVGVGTRYASGCTSGHGVCGLSRLSLRSLVATVAFMAMGFITVWGVRHAWA
jgi:uncharacterized protein